ncbi:DUF2840 domain-containing protein [Salinisphaera sp. RV14]|uniref:DUF2840 domain-containing protein n=1 Tax=Salinisphaera sp. RV14 TaxID=3454140 RepID=UPI003F877D94
MMHSIPAAVTPMPPEPHARAGLMDDTPLTRVSLVHVPQRLAVSLRFGAPARVEHLERSRRVAWFRSGAIFGRLYWRANAYGTVRRQLMVLQASGLWHEAQRIPGVRPGARVLLRAEGLKTVHTVLMLIDAIEAQGIALPNVAPTYWRTLGNRLAAHQPLPVYSAERHAVWRTGRRLQ